MVSRPSEQSSPMIMLLGSIKGAEARRKKPQPISIFFVDQDRVVVVVVAVDDDNNDGDGGALLARAEQPLSSSIPVVRRLLACARRGKYSLLRRIADTRALARLSRRVLISWSCRRRASGERRERRERIGWVGKFRFEIAPVRGRELVVHPAADPSA